MRTRSAEVPVGQPQTVPEWKMTRLMPREPTNMPRIHSLIFVHRLWMCWTWCPRCSQRPPCLQDIADRQRKHLESFSDICALPSDIFDVVPSVQPEAAPEISVAAIVPFKPTPQTIAPSEPAPRQTRYAALDIPALFPLLMLMLLPIAITQSNTRTYQVCRS